MRKIPLIVIAFYLKLLASFGQVTTPQDSSIYKERKLKAEEVNFVSGYYRQDGNHSGVTGGIGTEYLTDFANTIDLRLAKTNLKGNKHTLSFELGADSYTSASSDSIAPLTGASRSDVRIYPSVSYSSQNPVNGVTLGAGASFSHEFDYQSRGVNLSFAKTSKDENREFGVHLFAYLDSWRVILPYELRLPNEERKSEPRNSFQASFTLSQVVNERMQFAVLFDPAYQQGQLSTLYQRVYFTNQSVKHEQLPDNRMKIPVAARINYFLGDRFIIRAYYRFYNDDWKNTAHTMNLEIPVKLTPFFSLSPFFRYHTQSGISYFAPYGEHHTIDEFYTSDYDLSPFNSQLLGMGIRVVPPKGIFGYKHWNSLELRYGHYMKSTDLVADNVTVALKFK